MKIKIFASLLTAFFMVSCVGKKEASNQNNDNVDVCESIVINGRWNIENIVFNDSVYVRPSEEVANAANYIVFDEESYFIQTNCNTISGTYSLKGDSITLNGGIMTEMACDNMATEEALRLILPEIETIDAENDSIVRLNSRTRSEYVILHKMTERADK